MDMDNMSPGMQAAYLLFAFALLAAVFMFMMSKLSDEEPDEQMTKRSKIL
jgi:preprotein translocase subunit YajC